MAETRPAAINESDPTSLTNSLSKSELSTPTIPQPIVHGRAVASLGSTSLRRRAAVFPGFPAAGNGEDVGVTHLLEYVGGEG